jgi:hypothetical protein
MRNLILAIVVLAASGLEARADTVTAALREAAKLALRRAGQKVTAQATEKLAGRMAAVAASHGEQLVCQAVRRAGPRALVLAEQAGTHSGPALRLLAAYGERGAVAAARPQSLRLLARYGEQAVAPCLVKHPVIAEPLVERYGATAARALGAVEGQSARRLAMLAEDGTLQQIGRTPELLDVIARHGDAACAFVWRNKGALATTAGLAAFLSHPEEFIAGARDLTQVLAENGLKPLAELPAGAVREVARSINGTLVFLVLIAVLTLPAAVRRWRSGRGRPLPADAP